MNAGADPLAGWALSEVLEEPNPASKDLYGLLFLHVSRLLRKFCEKLRTVKLDVCLYQLDATVLPEEIKAEKRLYDRIEVTPLVSTCSCFPLLIMIDFKHLRHILFGAW